MAAKEKTQNVVVLPPVLLQLAAMWRIAAGCNAHTRPSQNRRMLACTLPARVDGALCECTTASTCYTLSVSEQKNFEMSMLPLTVQSSKALLGAVINLG